jgi:poly-gamma-glutamate capsule biosynthesis protein CapA/YwtB (metallophosphatase superfamily)
VTRCIGLLGDVMLGRQVGERLAAVPPANVWAPNLREIASRCDLVLCNIECCISDRGQPTDLVAGKPFFFRAPPVAVESLKAIGVDAVTLANNHALDFGSEALEDTLRHLANGGIVAAGAGPDVEQARRGVVVSAAGMRLGLLAASDHPREFAAGPERGGIAQASLSKGAPDWLLAELDRLRQECDYLLVFLHWGPNMADRPARWQRTLAAELRAAGADMVAGHSAHVFQGVEQVEEGLVAYDLGDALDDYAVDRQLRNDLGVFALWHPDASPPRLELFGLRLDFCYTQLAAGADADWIAARLGRACAEFGTAVDRVSEQRFVITAPKGSGQRLHRSRGSSAPR